MNDTRERLLRATRRCITSKGLAGTTSREITAKAGVNLAAITYHFGSKEDLVAAALMEGLRTWLTPTIEVLGGEGDPATRTALAITTLTSTFEQQKRQAPAYLQALVEAPRIKSLHTAVIDLWRELRSLLGRQIADMQNNGELEAWVDPEAMAVVLIALANGLVLQVTVDPDGPALEDMAAQFGSLLLAVRRAPGSTPAGAP
ncbi:MAG: TetR/AcrR family transcriptional regulator [Acidimicrobiales bacterium]